MDRFAYFTLRLRIGDKPAPATGTVEDLATGEKREFTGAEQLLELLGARPPVSPNMPPETGAGQMPEER